LLSQLHSSGGTVAFEGGSGGSGASVGLTQPQLNFIELHLEELN